MPACHIYWDPIDAEFGRLFINQGIRRATVHGMTRGHLSEDDE